MTFMGVIGVGVDAVDIAWFRCLVGAGRRRCAPVCSPPRTPISPAVPSSQVPGLAARLAAREAVMKAMGIEPGALGFHEVWVRRATSG